MKKKVAIIGAGFTGLSAARTFAEAGYDVQVFEKEETIGGVCSDYEKDGCIIQKYGPHIFHTNDETAYKFVCRFGEMKKFEHRAKARTKMGFIDYPINYNSLEILYATDVERAIHMMNDDIEIAKTIFEGERDRNFRVAAICNLGQRIYDEVIHHYTKLQWQRDPHQVPFEVFSRMRISYDRTGLFFPDRWVCLPVKGYSVLFAAMANHPNIHIQPRHVVACDLDWLTDEYDYTINTGPCGILLGEENNETLKLEFGYIDEPAFSLMPQHGVINYCDSGPFTRATNYGMFNGIPGCLDFIISERPSKNGLELYPVRTKNNIKIHEDQKERLMRKGVHTVGRLGDYKYINMDQAVLNGIGIAKSIIEWEE